MKKLLLLALPILLTACPADQPAPGAPDAAAPAASAEPAAPVVERAKDEAGKPLAPDAAAPFMEISPIRAIGTLPTQHWTLSEATDAKGQRIEALFARAGKPVTIDFASNGSLSVKNACNAMSGPYQMASATTIQVGPLASTRKACADAKLAALDEAIGKRLDGTLQLRMALGTTPRLRLVTTAGDALVFDGSQTAATRYGSAGKQVFLEVAAEEVACPDTSAKRPCLQVREVRYDDAGLKTGTPGDYAPYAGQIEGYGHQRGVRNIIRVQRYPLATPPAEGPATVDVLDMVIEAEQLPAAKDAAAGKGKDGKGG